MESELFKVFDDNFTDEFFVSDDYFCVWAKKPNKLESLEDLLNIDEQKSYFKSLKNYRMRDPDMCAEFLDIYELRCDYCNISTDPSDYETFYFCNTCENYMCKMCFEEDTEEKALANGATKWNLRKDALEKCRTHDLKKINKMVIDDQTFHYNSDFGSILDWLLVYIDSDNDYEDFILKNCNPENKHFGKYALCASDSHGRTGYYITNLNLEEIKKRLDIYEKKYNKCDEEYWPPIKCLMDEQGFQTYYG